MTDEKCRHFPSVRKRSSYQCSGQSKNEVVNGCRRCFGKHPFGTAAAEPPWAFDPIARSRRPVRRAPGGPGIPPPSSGRDRAGGAGRRSLLFEETRLKGTARMQARQPHKGERCCTLALL